ncbi:hypothetical protein DM15PD_04910 [Aristophania vespae]|nr:hypothetical protein DM15PD_04910 [Aristophania vespae]
METFAATEVKISALMDEKEVHVSKKTFSEGPIMLLKPNKTFLI